MSKKILIVDDDQDQLMGLSVLLRGTGYDVAVATEGVGAISEARRVQPDLIILDIGLPAGDGFWILERLKKNMAFVMTPVIVLTARDAEQARVRAEKGGAAAFFQKPADTGELLDKIEELVR